MNMKCKVILKTALMVALFVMVLLGLANCRRQQEPTPFSPYTPSAIVDSPTPNFSSNNGVPSAVSNLPEPIQNTHRGTVFLITWFAPPFQGYYDRLSLRDDSSISYSQVVVDLALHSGSWGQLTDEEREEVQVVLKAMTEISLTGPLTGSQIITLSFLWEGDNHVLSFNESNCPSTLHRLFEIADAASKRNSEWYGVYPNPCQKDNEYDEQAQEPILPKNTSFHLDLPEPVRQAHEAPRLFCATWFEQPFDGSYKELSLFASNSVVYWQLWAKGGREVAKGRLTEKERQDVQDTLALMIDMTSVEQPTGTTTVTLSFPWRANTYLFTYGESGCPDELDHLFEIASAAFKRDSSILVSFQSPCQGR